MEALVGAFKEIALDKDRRESLLADTTSLSGLVLLLSKENFSVTLEVLEIFSALIECETGSLNLSKLIGLKESLAMLKTDENLPERVRDLASEIYVNISFKKPSLYSAEPARTKPKHQSYDIVIQLTGNLVMTDLKTIEEQLLTIKGIISITFQLHKLRIIVMALNTVSKEAILERVNSVCEKLASDRSQFDISAYFLRRQKSTLSRQGVKRKGSVRIGIAPATEQHPSSVLKQPSFSQASVLRTNLPQRQTFAPLPPLKPYLSEEADIFEVDEKRGAPLPRDAALGEAGQRSGIGGWLSDILERTLFW